MMSLYLDESCHGLCKQQEGVGATRGRCKWRNGTQHVEVPHRLLDTRIEHCRVWLLLQLRKERPSYKLMSEICSEPYKITVWVLARSDALRQIVSCKASLRPLVPPCERCKISCMKSTSISPSGMSSAQLVNKPGRRQQRRPACRSTLACWGQTWAEMLRCNWHGLLLQCAVSADDVDSQRGCAKQPSSGRP